MHYTYLSTANFFFTNHQRYKTYKNYDQPMQNAVKTKKTHRNTC